MAQEEKQLLLQDLCGRLPYGVKIALKNSEAYHHENVAKKGDITIDKLKGFNGSYFSIYHDNPLDWDWYVSDIGVEDIKPYLRPLSSMTEEEYEEYTNIDNRSYSCPKDYAHIPASERIDWLNAHHFDYRGLIEKGLALEAPKGMYK